VDADEKPVVPVWTLATRDVSVPSTIPGTERMNPEVLRGLRTTWAALADVPIATLEPQPLPANLDLKGRIRLESTSPLATHLSQQDPQDDRFRYSGCSGRRGPLLDGCSCQCGQAGQ
jgi:hypothetical protein